MSITPNKTDAYKKGFNDKLNGVYNNTYSVGSVEEVQYDYGWNDAYYG